MTFLEYHESLNMRSWAFFIDIACKRGPFIRFYTGSLSCLGRSYWDHRYTSWKSLIDNHISLHACLVIEEQPLADTLETSLLPVIMFPDIGTSHLMWIIWRQGFASQTPSVSGIHYSYRCYILVLEPKSGLGVEKSYIIMNEHLRIILVDLTNVFGRCA